MSRPNSFQFTVLSALVVLFAGCGCGSLQEKYVDADSETYDYAQPKLTEWAKAKGDPEWEAIVKDKGIAWKSRIDRARASIERSKERGEEN